MKLGSSKKNASDQALCCNNQKIKNQPVRRYDLKARDGPVALM